MGSSGSNQQQSDQSGPPKRHDILVVEDNRADVFLIRESIEIAQVDAALHVAQDGDRVIKFFEQSDRDPSAPCAEEAGARGAAPDAPEPGQVVKSLLEETPPRD